MFCLLMVFVPTNDSLCQCFFIIGKHNESTLTIQYTPVLSKVKLVAKAEINVKFRWPYYKNNQYFKSSCIPANQIIVVLTQICVFIFLSITKAQNMTNFHNFSIFENLSICLAKICVTKFQKSKFWDEHFLCLSMLKVGTYNLAAISYRIWY